MVGDQLLASSDPRNWLQFVGTSAASKTNGSLLFLDLDNIVCDEKTRSCSNDAWSPINLVGYPFDLFRPHGVSLLETSGSQFVFVVNHRGQDSVEIFERVGDSLHHRSSVQHPLLQEINDVHAVSSSSFYVTRFLRHHPGTFMNLVETTLRMPWGYVAYCIVQNSTSVDCKIALDGLRMPNGIHGNGSFFFVIETLADALLVLRRHGDNTLSRSSTVPLGSACDNLDLDDEGNLFTACHPKTLSFMLHSKDHSRPSPSQVLKIAPNGTVSELFMSHGDDLPASSAALCHGGTVYIGSVFGDGVLACPHMCD